MQRARKLLGRAALAVLGPLLVLGACEAILRGFNIGHPTAFLLEADVRGKAALVNNPFYGYRFFPPALARNPAPIVTTREKPADTIRIVVLGESAAQGDPVIEFGLPRMLERMLNEAGPGVRFEVVNAAMTAINSHVIQDIARDTLACQPDLYILYIGNNEVIGPYGPGTVFTAWPGLMRLAPLRVSLTRHRLSFALRQMVDALQGGAAGPAQWDGLAMFAERAVPADAPSLEVMTDQFARNLSRIVRAAQRQGAQVILSSVAVNLSDCSPFGQDPAAHAEYERAQTLLRQGARGEALAAFKQARDLDTQRFRTDSRLNARLHVLAGELNTAWVDAERAFEEAAENGVPGRALFLDHVHFTFEGNVVLARAFAEQVAALFPEVSFASPFPDKAGMHEAMFYSPWCQRRSAQIMSDRRRLPPFRDQPDNAAQLQELETIINEQTARINQSDLDEWRARYEALQARYPNDFFLAFQWGAALCELGHWVEAAGLLSEAMTWTPLHFEARKLPALALSRSGEVTRAAETLLGPASHRGDFVAEYTLDLMRLLDRSGYPAEATRLGRAVLEQAPNLPQRQRVVTALRALESRS